MAGYQDPEKVDYQTKLIKQESQQGAAPDRPLAQIQAAPAFSQVSFQLGQGEAVVADNGRLNWMDSTVQMSTWCYAGGCCAGICRRIACEHCCINRFEGPGNASFSYDLPGDTLPFLVTPEQGWVVMAGSYVVGTETVKVSAKFSGCTVCCCGDQGPLFTHMTADGSAGVGFCSAFGAIKRHEVPEGQTLLVGTRNFFAATDSTKIGVGCPGNGCKQWCCSKEGFVLKIFGPGIVYTHNRDETAIRALLFPGVQKQAEEAFKLIAKCLELVQNVSGE
jgi:uncharacterized protein (AIM24 family)